jgi:hypothetical protein
VTGANRYGVIMTSYDPSQTYTPDQQDEAARVGQRPRKRASKADRRGKEAAARAEGYAARIKAAWNKQVAAIIEIGQLLIEAKASLAHSEWLKMFTCSKLMKQRLPFSERTAQMLMKVASHPVLANPKFVSDLPPSYATLHQLSAIDAPKLEDMIERGDIHPEMTRAEIQQLDFFRFEQAHAGLKAFLYFMRRMPPEELAEGIKWHQNSGPWMHDELDAMRKLPFYMEEVRLALVGEEDRSKAEFEKRMEDYRLHEQELCKKIVGAAGE